MKPAIEHHGPLPNALADTPPLRRQAQPRKRRVIPLPELNAVLMHATGLGLETMVPQQLPVECRVSFPRGAARAVPSFQTRGSPGARTSANRSADFWHWRKRPSPIRVDRPAAGDVCSRTNNPSCGAYGVRTARNRWEAFVQSSGDAHATPVVCSSPLSSLRDCLKTRPVGAPGLQAVEIPVVSCRPRALTRRGSGGFRLVLGHHFFAGFGGSGWSLITPRARRTPGLCGRAWR